MNNAPSVSVVVPTYKGVASIEELIDRVDRVLSGEVVNHEIVIVNDASPDETAQALVRARQRHPDTVKVLTLLSNHGQAVATMCGLAHARGQVVVTMDDDLQHPPEEIPVLLDALSENPSWDAVIGHWDRDHGFLRGAGSAVHGFADRLAYRTPKGFRLTAFRALRRPVVDAVVTSGTRTPVVTPMILASASEVHNVSVDHHERPYGQSTFSVRSGIARTVQNFLQGSTLPLRLLSRFGIAVSLIALIIGSFMLIRWFLGANTPPGWMSTFLATMFLGGAILVAIGLQGEYIALVMKNVTNPPRWSIKSTSGFDGPSTDLVPSEPHDRHESTGA